MTPSDPTPTPGEERLTRLVADLRRSPPADWPAVVRRYVAEMPDDPGEVLEAAAVLAATHAADPARAAEQPAWRAVLDGLAAEYPPHATDIRACGHLPPAVAGPKPAGGPLLQPGDRLGPFVVGRFLAHGGMGEVYAAEQDVLNRTVALKVIRGTAGPLARARFLREQRVLARLHQTNIVPVHYAGLAGDRQFYAMQWVPGAPLHRVLTAVYQRETTAARSGVTPSIPVVVESLLKSVPAAPPPTGPTPAPTAAQAAPPPEPTPAVVHLSAAYFASAAAVMIQVAEAVQHGHEKGVLHRDIKPSNLIIDPAGTCWVIDYGLARAAPDTSDDTPEENEEPLTRGGVGTPQYMAPEQFAGTTDERSDVWSLGVTLYELLTLRPAFAGGPWRQVEERVRNESPASPRALVPTVPRDLIAVCAKAMARNPADRYVSAAGFADDLRRWREWQPTTARPGWRTLRPARLWAWRNKGSAAALLLVLAGLLGGNLLFAARAEQRRRELEFVAVFADAELVRHGRPFTGWSEQVRDRLRAAARLRPDADLRDHFLATAVGPDARLVRRHDLDVPRTDKITGWGSVAFGPDGRLLCGGLDQERTTGVDRSPAVLFDANAAAGPTASTRPGGGPIAFPAADLPLQLRLPVGDDRTLTLWNVGTNAAVAEVRLPAEPLRVGQVTAALSADGRRIAASVVEPPTDGPARGVTVVWEVDPRKPGPAIRAAGWDRPAAALAFAPDGRHLAAGDSDGQVTVHAPDGRELLRLDRQRAPVQALAFGRRFLADATGRPAPPADRPDWLLAVGTNSSRAEVFDLRTGGRVSACDGAAHYVNALAFTPDGGGLVTAGYGPPLLWDVSTGRPVIELTHGPDQRIDGYMTGVAVSADGRRVAVTGTNQHGPPAQAVVTELDPDRGVRVYRGLIGNVRNVWSSPTAGWVAGMSDDWRLAVWERATGRLAWVWDLPIGWTQDNCDLAFDEPAGTVYFASGTRVCRLSLTTGVREQSWAVPLGLNDALTVRPGRPPRLVRREPDGPLEPGRPRPPTRFRCRDLNPDGTLIERYVLPADFGPVGRARVLGGRFLAVGIEDGETRGDHLFDADTGRRLPYLDRLPFRHAKVLHVSDDGTRMMVYRDDLGRMSLHAPPDMAVLGEYPGIHSGVPDAAGRFLVRLLPPAGEPAGLAVVRAGDTRPLAVLDLGRAPVCGGLTADGRLAYWGRADGSVCVADVNRCLELAAEFTR